MSRVFLVGAGPMMDGGARRVTAHAMRTSHFLAALRRAGHDVVCATVSTNISPIDPEERLVERRSLDGFPYDNLDMRMGNMLAWLSDRCREVRPDCVVGVSTEPASWACQMKATVPLWADLHGWVMAEAQLKAAQDGDDQIISHFWRQERPVLRRADRISAVSNAQRFAVLGELATMGRLNRHNVGHELVVSIPSSVVSSEPSPDVAGNPVAERIGRNDAFVLLWSGGFNTWTDAITLFEGLEQAMECDDSIHFIATGGPLPGHADAVYERFRSNVERSPHHTRFHLLDWVAAEAFPGYLAHSDLAVCVDFPCVETLVGTRTRLLEAMVNGLPVLMTRGTELSEDLAAAGIGWIVPSGDPQALTDRIVACAQDRQATGEMAQRSQEWVRKRYSIERTLAPVLQWIERPVFAPDNAVKQTEAPAILDAAVNRLEANARALDFIEDAEAVVESHRRLERLRAHPLLRWFLR